MEWDCQKQGQTIFEPNKFYNIFEFFFFEFSCDFFFFFLNFHKTYKYLSILFYNKKSVISPPKRAIPIILNVN